MPYVAILAENPQEANAHVARQHLRKGSYRYAARAASVRKLRVSEIHILPGFVRRLDKHAILAELRYTKGKRIGFHEPRGYVNFEQAWDLAHAEQERRWNEGRLSHDDALEKAYITLPYQYDLGGSLPLRVTASVNATGKVLTEEQHAEMPIGLF